MLRKTDIMTEIESRFVVRGVENVEADADACAALFNKATRDFYGVEEYSAEEMPIDWGFPNIDREKDVRLVFTREGQLVAYGECITETPFVRYWVWSKVAPDYFDQGLGSYLQAWAEQRIRERLPEAPEGAKVFMRTDVASVDERGQRFLREHGFEQVRSFYRMVIDLNQPVPAPVIPAGLVIRTAQPNEKRAAIFAIRESFRDHFGFIETPFEEVYADYEQWMATDPHFDTSLIFVAMDGDEVAGVSLCYPHMEGYPGMGWVNQLGVRRAWRKRGLARALLLHSFREFQQRGFTACGLGVDAVNPTGAVRLYESAGMHVARTSYTFDRVIREGEDLSLRELAE